MEQMFLGASRTSDRLRGDNIVEWSGGQARLQWGGSPSVESCRMSKTSSDGNKQEVYSRKRKVPGSVLQEG